MPWTPDLVPSLAGRVVCITGANTGLGFENALTCAEKGATVVLACRDRDRGDDAAERIRAREAGADVEAMTLDLGSLASVRGFSEAFHARFDRLDGLVNNAGIMFVPYGLTEDGFEQHMGVNHLGHFALTGLLLDRLLATPGSRVVTVSSNGHRMGAMDFDNLLFEEGIGYSPRLGYGNSKLANLLFTFELQRRLEAAGAHTLALAAHPGASATDLGRHIEARLPLLRPLKPLVYKMLQSAHMGSLPTLRALVDPEVEGGEYFGPEGFREMRGYPVQVECSKAARSVEDAGRLWEASERLTGVTYDFAGTASESTG